MGVYYQRVEQFLPKIANKNWVEIGVERGEGSTRWFANRCEKLTAIDALESQAKNCQALLEKFNITNTTVVHAFGEEWASEYSGDPIDLLYLDNFDWNYWLDRGAEDPRFGGYDINGAKELYLTELDTELTNLTSQYTHLEQMMLLIDHMSEKSIVICDDTWFEPATGIFVGKCSAVIPYLLLQGYALVDYQGYRQNSGAIMIRE